MSNDIVSVAGNSASKVPDQQPSVSSSSLRSGSIPNSYGNESVGASKHVQDSETIPKDDISNQKPSTDKTFNQESSANVDFSVSPEKSVMRESVSIPATSTSTFSATPQPKRVRGPNRSEAERIAEFRDDPQVKDFDPVGLRY